MRSSTSTAGSWDSKPAANRWPPPPFVDRDLAHVERAERAQAHAYLAVDVFLDHAGDLGLGGPPQDVDEAFDLLELHAVTIEHVAGDDRGHEATGLVELRGGQRLTQHLEVREAVLLEELARQARHRHVERHQLAGEVEHTGAGGVVLEAAGVAHQRRVERHRGVVGERQPELEQEAAHEHATGGRAGIDHVDGAEAGVRHVVVEHDQLPRGLGRRFEVAQTT